MVTVKMVEVKIVDQVIHCLGGVGSIYEKGGCLGTLDFLVMLVLQWLF